MRTVAAVIPVYNEKDRIVEVIRKFSPGLVDEVIVVDDGSTDGSGEIAWRSGPVTLLVHAGRRGVGAALRTGIDHAVRRGHEVVVIMAGNGKDDPGEIPRLLGPVELGEADYVQGSRYLAGGVWDNLPRGRRFAMRLFTLLWSFMLAKRLSDVTNGFRAYVTRLLLDPRINIRQSWLDGYQMEYYLHYKVLSLGYRFLEVPVSKRYPRLRGRGYSKIRPGRDWWQIAMPLLALRCGFKR